MEKNIKTFDQFISEKLYGYDIDLSELHEGINEARKDSTMVEYTIKTVKKQADSIIAFMKGGKAGKVNKLANRYDRVKTQLDKLKKEKKELEAEIREYADENFDEEDKVLTRVMETNEVVLKVSKQSKSRKEDVDYEAILDKLIEMLPEQEEMIEQLREDYTTIKETTRKSRITYKTDKTKESLSINEKKIKDYIKDAIKGLINQFKKWYNKMFKKYDKHLEELKNIVNK
jgi:DNA repair exonuclease SbcCD ATPase subunit